MSAPAPAPRAVAALTALELRLTARRGENVLVTIVIPVAVLLFFARAAALPGTGSDPVAFLLPGVIALAVIASGLVNLGIATAYDRSYGVLKRLGGAPIPRWGVVVAKLAAVAILELVQVAVLVAVATLALGWQPGPGWSPVIVAAALVMGTLAFAGLGLLLAGTLRAEATLALANGLFLAFLMLGGVVLPVDQLPGVVQPLAAALPVTALADLLREGLGHEARAGAAQSAVVLAAWAIGATGLAALRFRVD